MFHLRVLSHHRSVPIVFFGSANDDLVLKLTCIHDLELDLLTLRDSDLARFEGHATVRFDHCDLYLPSRQSWIPWLAVARVHVAVVMACMTAMVPIRVMPIGSIVRDRGALCVVLVTGPRKRDGNEKAAGTQSTDGDFEEVRHLFCSPV